MKDYLTVKDVAKHFKKHPTTVRRWISAKRLIAEKIAGKVYLVSKSDVLEFMMNKVLNEK